MSKRHKPLLGRGLDSLLGGTSTDATLEGLQHGAGLHASSIATLPLSLIDPNKAQPRQDFDQERIEELATSIRSLGLIQPITVQPQPDGRYLIISGERRYRAAQLAGLTELPVYVRQAATEEILELALVENIQREDLNAIEIALAYQQLSESLGLTHEALAERVGKKRATVSNYLRLLRLPAQIQLGLSQRLLEMAHARALLQVEDPERQLELYQMTITEKLSVREVEDLARAIEQGQPEEETSDIPPVATRGKASQPQEFKALEHHLGQVFGAKVSLRCSPKGKGRITIPFAGEEELERIILLLERIQKG